jgi:hypothetical protein
MKRLVRPPATTGNPLVRQKVATGGARRKPPRLMNTL